MIETCIPPPFHRPPYETGVIFYNNRFLPPSVLVDWTRGPIVIHGYVGWQAMRMDAEGFDAEAMDDHDA